MKTTSSKLSSLQIEVLKLMNRNWHLDRMFTGPRGDKARAWLQYDSIGGCGETKIVDGRTFNSLLNRDYIVHYTRQDGTEIYGLTLKGIKEISK